MKKKEIEIELFKRYKAEAEKGYAKAQYQLGQCFEYGRGVDQDDRQAAEWYHKASKQGVSDADLKLSSFYNQGKGVKKDAKKAVFYTWQAFEVGNLEAICDVASFCANKGDDDRAVKLYRKAAEQGYADAQFALGRCYAMGKGVDMDVKNAVHWCRRAAMQGHVVAQYLINLSEKNAESAWKTLKEDAKKDASTKTHTGDLSTISFIKSMRTCANCGSSNAKMICKGCFQKHYCSKECATADWEKHKSYCKKVDWNKSRANTH